MSYEAKVYNVLIASPGDVAVERRIARDIILAWNNMHSERRLKVLMPILWESHSSPMTGDRPQGIINKQLLETADLLIAIFWTRFGSPTGTSPSGTVEEIETHVARDKPAMIYFSSAPVHQDSVDDAQYSALKEFRDALKLKGLYETFEGIGDFREKLTRQLTMTVYRSFDDGIAGEASISDGVVAESVPHLSEAARQLLLEASQDRTGYVVMARTFDGVSVETNGRNFVEQGNPRSAAAWEGAVGDLVAFSLLQERGQQGQVFRITDEGYRVADLLRG